MKCETQVIQKCETEKIRIKQKGAVAEVRIWSRQPAGVWRPTEKFINVPMERLITLEKQCEAALKASASIERQAKKELTLGTNVVPIALIRDSNQMKTKLAMLDQEFGREHQKFRAQLAQAVELMIKGGEGM